MSSETVHVRLNEALVDRLDARARSELRSRSGMLKVIVVRGLAEDDEEDS